jgi:BlaI family transcriptional regulator, penicillinase repressor
MGEASEKIQIEELPESELEVLAALWNGGPQTAAELRETLRHFRPMAHGSVLTLLKRLADKGLVERTKSGRGKAFLYRARVDRRAGHRRLMRRLTQRIFGNNLATVVASLLSSRKPTPEELAEIRQMLDAAGGSSKAATEEPTGESSRRKR